jgi:hypothetical protein
MDLETLTVAVSNDPDPVVPLQHSFAAEVLPFGSCFLDLFLSGQEYQNVTFAFLWTNLHVARQSDECLANWTAQRI